MACSPVLHSVQRLVFADIEAKIVRCECNLQVHFLALSFLAPETSFCTCFAGAVSGVIRRDGGLAAA